MANLRKPAASTTHSRSRTQVSNERSPMFLIRKPAAAGVMAQHLVLAGEDVEPWPPGKAAPLMLKMSEPGRGHDQRRSISACRVGKPHTICCRAEMDVLVHGGGTRLNLIGLYHPSGRGAPSQLAGRSASRDKNYSRRRPVIGPEMDIGSQQPGADCLPNSVRWSRRIVLGL